MTDAKPTKIGSDAIFLSKAAKLMEAAQQMLTGGNWEAAAVLAVHATISSCDALTARLLGRRHSGANHLDVLDLMDELPIADKRTLKSKARQVRETLVMKNKVEYQDRVTRQEEARTLVTQAGRVHDWVKGMF